MTLKKGVPFLTDPVTNPSLRELVHEFAQNQP